VACATKSARRSPEERARLGTLRRRILIGPTSPTISASCSAPRAAVLRPIHEAFFELRLLEVDYATEDAHTQRTVEPQYVLLSWPAWYLLVWDHLRPSVIPGDADDWVDR
jgi:predicted DNA-binding transcriptional regulator YafY